ncbi:hypothetical protein OUZ56_021352 [Daphnia magna]|uniref:Uncharacterized protein n=1 Tax=Daphnia magna TaxID=35525 RepID=A0ABQ9ZH61_9CRUS|nr:hypothetical protein OUZ56_021352 [Daphnia magna]
MGGTKAMDGKRMPPSPSSPVAARPKIKKEFLRQSPFFDRCGKPPKKRFLSWAGQLQGAYNVRASSKSAGIRPDVELNHTTLHRGQRLPIENDRMTF